MRLKKKMLTAAMASAVLMVAASAATAGSHDSKPENRSADQESSGEVLAALERDLGLSADQAQQLAAAQARAIQVDKKLQGELGKAHVSSAFDAESGRLTVTVSNRKHLDAVRSAGADAKLADHGRGKLEKIKAELDAAAGLRSTEGPQARKANGPRKAAAAELSTWYVDAASNTVHVTVEKGHLKKAAKSLAKYGDAVTIEQVSGQLVPTDRYFDGGDMFSGKCSNGFNVRNKSTGQGYMITAGHCVKKGETVYGHDWTKFGPVLESWYPGLDDAIVRNDSSGYWIQGPWVDTNPSHGGFISVSGYTDAPVGTTICKSGITTKYTCGQITAKNVTSNYGDGAIYGLTQHNACAEKGDSGGATVSLKWNWNKWAYDYAAEGMTSGGRLYLKDGKLRCGQEVGQPNVTLHFPIADSLPYYGPKYGVSLW